MVDTVDAITLILDEKLYASWSAFKRAASAAYYYGVNELAKAAAD